MMKYPSFIFFDLGQTLIDEWDYIAYFDQKFLELLNGFGARIDQRNYHAIRDSIIRDRKIGHGSVKELVIEVCKLLSPPGYEKVIASRLEPHIRQGRRDLFKFFDDAEPTLKALSKYCQMGIDMHPGSKLDSNKVRSVYESTINPLNSKAIFIV